MRLAGKVAIITGAGQGVGLGIALAFAAQGADLVISGRDEKKLAAAETELAARGAKSWPSAVTCVSVRARYGPHTR